MKEKTKASKVNNVEVIETVNCTADNWDFSMLPAGKITLTLVTSKKSYNVTVKTTDITKQLKVGNGVVVPAVREKLTSMLNERHALTAEERNRYGNDVSIAYRYVLKRLKDMDKKNAFEKSGILFKINEQEVRFLPKRANENEKDFILFRSIDSNALCFLKKEVAEDGKTSASYGVLAKGGKYASVKNTLVSLTRSTLMQWLNDTFNGMSWEKIIELCKQVEKFTTCSLPKALKEL